MMLTSALLEARSDILHGFSFARPRNVVGWRAVATATGHPSGDVARANQVHGAVALEVDQPGPAGDADALITDMPGLMVAVVTADCVPVLVAGNGVVAAIHAGWRGVAAGVIPATLAKLEGRGPFVAAIGPCIRSAVYETGDAVVAAIVGSGVPDAIVAVRRPEWPKVHADIAAAAAFQLRASGCAVVDDVGTCTFTDHRFASYRREANASGRQVSLIGLRP